MLAENEEHLPFSLEKLVACLYAGSVDLVNALLRSSAASLRTLVLEYHDQESIDFDLTIFPNLRDLTWTAHFASGDYSAVAEQIKHATKTLHLQRLALIQADRDQDRKSVV